MLKAQDLWKQVEQQKTIKMNAMKPVLTNLFAQLKTHAGLHPDSPVFAFDVPSFVFGYPLYDHKEAIQFCRETLEERGFQVWVSGSVLVISWIKSEKQKTLGNIASYRPFAYDPSAMEFLKTRIR